jgi:hypothetical protein
MKSYWIIEWRDGSRSEWPSTLWCATDLLALRNVVSAFLLTVF